MILTEYVMYRGKKKRVEDLSPNNRYKVDVQCPICKDIREVYHRSIIKAGHTMCQSCSVKQKMRKFIEEGTKFNRLTVINPSEKSGYSVCRCDCGNITEVSNAELKRETTKSCGCLRSENIREVSHHPTGEEHWNWKGGKTDERRLAMSQKEYKDWRTSVFERDDYTCQKCKQWGKQLRAHHILNFADHPGLRTDLNNGVTLCEECHREFHGINGFNTTMEQLEEFLSTQN